MKYIQKRTTENNHKISTIRLENIPKYDLYDYDLTDDKEVVKYIKEIERVCRSSFEYSQLMNYLKKYQKMHQCALFKNVSCLENKKIKIQIHHEPFNLYDIVEAVYNKRLAYNQSTEIELVSHEVMYIHYINMVGLIPLSETPHELVTNHFYQIPMSKVRGNFLLFIELYGEYISDKAMDRYRSKLNFENMYNAMSIPENNILQTDYLYIDHDLNKVSSYTNIVELLEDRQVATKNQMYGGLMDTRLITRDIKSKEDKKNE